MAIQVKATSNIIDFDEKKLELIKNMYAKNCTNDELDIFIHACKRLGLDPFMKQIYAIKRGNSMTIQVGIDGYRLVAERTGRYMPGKETTYTYDGKQLVSATAYVKKKDADGQWHEIGGTAFLSEYGSTTGLWSKMPHVMLSKCAESVTLRKAFPSEMSGVYTEEEMQQSNVSAPAADAIDVPVEKVVDNLISMEDAELLDERIGDDFDYRKKLLEYLKIESFYDLERSKFPAVLRRIQKHNELRLKEEMAVGE